MTEEELEKEVTEYVDGKGHEHYIHLFEENAESPADFARLCFKDGYNKCKEELEKENGKLEGKLIKAKEIIKRILHTFKNNDSDFTFALKPTHSILLEAEQFLKEE